MYLHKTMTLQPVSLLLVGRTAKLGPLSTDRLGPGLSTQLAHSPTGPTYQPSHSLPHTATATIRILGGGGCCWRRGSVGSRTPTIGG